MKRFKLIRDSRIKKKLKKFKYRSRKIKNVLSLFDGMSGLQIALNRGNIKFDNYYSSEIDKYSKQIAQKNYPDTIQLGNIKDYKSWNIDDISLICGGFPCQSYSQAGKRKGLDDDRGKLIFDVFNVVKKFKPDDLLFENVKGLLNHNKGKSFAFILSEINECGYAVDWHLINSALVSAQNRQRIYIIGRRLDLCSNIYTIEENGYKIIKFNSGLTQPKDKGILLKDVVLNDVKPIVLHNLYGGFKEKNPRVFENKSPTIRTSTGGGHIPSFIKKIATFQKARGNNPGGIRSLNGKVQCVGSSSWEHNNYVVTFTERRTEDAKLARRKYKRLHNKDFSPRRMKEIVPRMDNKSNCITTFMTIEHLLLTNKALKYMDRKVKGGRSHWEFKHHSDISDKKSATIVANFFKGVPYNVFKDWDCIRKFDPIECERLQTISDGFTEGVSNSQRYKMVGNGYTIDVITYILRNIIK